MPILYSNKNNKNNMKELKLITQMSQSDASDWIRIKNKPVMEGYSIVEANRLAELVRTYIDVNQRSCAHCGTTGGLREAKDKFIQYFIDNEINITKISNNISIIEEEIVEVIEEPKVITKKNKRTK